MAKIERVEAVGELRILRILVSNQVSYDLVDADDTVIASTWSINKGLDAWATKGGAGPKFRPLIRGEANAVAWLRRVAA